MKKMRLFIGMLIATLLLGCVTADQQYKELSSKKEVIKSFFIADNRIYAIGQLNSYQFNSKDNGNTAQLIKLLESPYTKNISFVKIDEIRKNVKSNEVEAFLSIYFNHKNLTKAQLDELYNINSPYRDGRRMFFSMNNGNLVDIKNKNEILQKAKLIQPLETKYVEFSNEKEISINKLNKEEAALSAIIIPFAIIGLPFAIVEKVLTTVTSP